jgi:hypothetical protein
VEPTPLRDSHPLLSRKRLQLESGHGQVGNETTGMQTTNVAEADSLSRLGARGSSNMMNLINFRLNCVIIEKVIIRLFKTLPKKGCRLLINLAILLTCEYHTYRRIENI